MIALLVILLMVLGFAAALAGMVFVIVKLTEADRDRRLAKTKLRNETADLGAVSSTTPSKPITLQPAQKVRIFLLFLLAGPPLGALPLSVYLLLASIKEANIFITIPTIFIVSLFSYPFGLIPAGIAAALFLFIAVPRLSTTSSPYTLIVSAALCGFVGVFIALFILELLSDNYAKSSMGYGFFYSICGVISGGFCGYFARRFIYDSSPYLVISKGNIVGWISAITLIIAFFGIQKLMHNG